jgi:hypothetical protein
MSERNVEAKLLCAFCIFAQKRAPSPTFIKILLLYVYNMRVLGRAQVPSQYHSTTVVPRAIARGTTYCGTGLGTCIKTEAEG